MDLDTTRAQKVLDIANELAVLNMELRAVETSYANAKHDIGFYIQTGFDQNTVKLVKDLAYSYQNQITELKTRQRKLSVSVLRRVYEVIEEEIQFE